MLPRQKNFDRMIKNHIRVLVFPTWTFIISFGILPSAKNKTKPNRTLIYRIANERQKRRRKSSPTEKCKSKWKRVPVNINDNARLHSLLKVHQDLSEFCAACDDGGQRQDKRLTEITVVSLNCSIHRRDGFTSLPATINFTLILCLYLRRVTHVERKKKSLHQIATGN